MQFDPVLRAVGEFGPYQRRIFVLVSLIWFPMAFHGLLPAFTAPTQVAWHCRRGHNCSAPAGDSFDATVCREGGWEFARPHETITAEYGLVCEDSSAIGLVGAAYFVGVGIGAALGGRAADRYGRKPTFFGATALSGVAGCLTAAMPTFTLYLGARVLAGVGTSAASLVSYVWLLEFVGPSRRGLVGTASLAFFAVGEMLLSYLAYQVRPWRVLTMAMSLPTFLILAMWGAIPESPQWLHANGRKLDAERILKAMAEANGRAEVMATLQMPASRTANLSDASESLYIKFFAHGSRHGWHLLVLAWGWLVCNILYYGLSLAAGSLGGSVYINFFMLSLAELPGKVVAVSAMDQPRFGRRWTYILSSFSAGLMCLSVTMVGDSFAMFKTGVALVGKAMITSAFVLAFLVTTELFPERLRGSAMGICSMSSRLGSVLAPFIAFLTKYGDALPYTIFGVLGLSSGLAFLLLPETGSFEDKGGRAGPEAIPMLRLNEPNRDDHELSD